MKLAIGSAIKVLAGSLILLSVGLAQDPATDLILKAMRDEMARASKLSLAGFGAPYYLEYSLDDGESISASASLGGLIAKGTNRIRFPRTQVRVGSYELDNTNSIYARFGSSSRFDPEQLADEAGYEQIRRHFWLATDRTYKNAVEAFARKQAAMRSVNQSEKINDFAKSTPRKLILPVSKFKVDTDAWATRIKGLSMIFSKYPKILDSSVEFSSSQSTFYLVNSEGTEVRTPDHMVTITARAYAQAPDGMLLSDAAVVQAAVPSAMPSDVDLQREIGKLADSLTSLAQAPVGESYSGPVLFESMASAQLFAELLGPNLALNRKPISEPGREMNMQASELEGRIGSRILPDWMDVVDDATQIEWRGKPLFGNYLADMDGIPPQPVKLVEKGVLKTYLMSRLPVRGLEGSNGHGRLPGAYGSSASTIGTMFIRANQTAPLSDLKKKLIEMVQARGKSYGILIRKNGFPAVSLPARANGSTRLVSAPVMVFKVYPDGREELVRGLRYRGLSVRTLKDIIAASDENYVFDYVGNAAPLSLIGAGGYVVNSTVVAPAILFDDFELERPQEELPKQPIVPPPS